MSTNRENWSSSTKPKRNWYTSSRINCSSTSSTSPFDNHKKINLLIATISHQNISVFGNTILQWRHNDVSPRVEFQSILPAGVRCLSQFMRFVKANRVLSANQQIRDILPPFLMLTFTILEKELKTLKWTATYLWTRIWKSQYFDQSTELNLLDTFNSGEYKTTCLRRLNCMHFAHRP